MTTDLDRVETGVPTRTAEAVALEIRTLKQQAQGVVLSYAIEIGRRLEEAKAIVPHGEWGNWLKSEVDYSQSTAQNLMRISREYGADQQSLFGGVAKSQTIGNLTYTKALALLALPDEERESFAQENDVASMSTRELEQAIRERNEAQARETEARNRADGLQIKLDAAKRRESELMSEAEGSALAISEAEALRDRAKEAKEAAETKVRALMTELEELKARPVEVAVEVDEEAVERARAETRAEMEEKLREAVRAREAAEKKQREADKSLAALVEKAQAEARAEMKGKLDKAVEKQKMAEERAKELEERSGAGRDAERDHIRDLEKKLAAAEPGVAAFKVLYTAWQEEFNKLLAAMEDVGAETRPKLLAAVSKALEQMGARLS